MKIMLIFHLIFLIVYIFMHLYFDEISKRLKICEFVSKKYLVKTQVHEIKNSLFCGSTSLVVLKLLKETLER